MEVSILSRRKNHVYKNQGWDFIHQKYKANEIQVDTTQRKNKSKQSTKNNKKTHANRTYGYEMMLNNNKEDLR
jgi:hypothetical protein